MNKLSSASLAEFEVTELPGHVGDECLDPDHVIGGQQFGVGDG